MAMRDFVICLAICAMVGLIDQDALINPIRLAVMLVVTVLVPALNYIRYRRLCKFAS